MKIESKELHIIFQGIANKDEKQFNKLFKKYQGLVYAIAFSILKNSEDSEEVVQNVFAKIWSTKKENLPTNHESSWLYRLTKNETLNFLKSKKKETSIEEVYDISENEQEIKDLLGKDAYCRIISKLEPKDQEIVSLKVLSNLSFREIAQLLNMPIGTVQWRYYKSMNTLKLLITNLSIFIITMGIFVVNRFHKKEGNLADISQMGSDEDKFENVQEAEKQDSINNLNNSNNSMQADIIKENSIYDNAQIEETNTETTENVIVDNQEVINLTNIDIGILTILGISLLFTIIFFIIFLKHQQKVHKRLSK